MKHKILIVDDSPFNRQVLCDILGNEYDLIEAENGRQALEIIEEKRRELSAVLLDIVMPEIDGVALLKILNEKKYIDQFPILVVSGEQSLNLVAECFDIGISDYIRKPVNTDFVQQRVKKLVELYQQKNDFKELVEKQTRALKGQYKLLQQQAVALKAQNDRITDLLAAVVEYRNMENGDHVKRVKAFTKILAIRMMEDYPEYELTTEKIKRIASASVLHDVGKVMIPDSILLKPGMLTEEEKEYEKSHTIRGYDIISEFADVWDSEYEKCCKEIARWHHERDDGNGYPDGLKGEEIPISAQLVSLADCLDSLISERVHKGALPFDEAYNKILQGECGVFSYKLLECFREVRQELEECAASFKTGEESDD